MASNYFFLQADKDEKNHIFLDALEEYANRLKQQLYVIDRPLGDVKYAYSYKDALVVLIPKHKILFVNFGADRSAFEDYCEDFIEDLGSISDKYRYKEFIGRPRLWRDHLIDVIIEAPNEISADDFMKSKMIVNAEQQRICELIISLLTGSINDIEKVKGNVPSNLLDKVKQKILLFDGEQTRFVYQEVEKPKISIQGLSGTGKTELLLHKLKELYIKHDNSKIIFTCHNKILANNLRKRIPEFFNFMKVEQQIKWNERLWCVNAWGSQDDSDSGAYRYICFFYKTSFFRYSGEKMTFSQACKIALEEVRLIKATSGDEFEFAFDYMLIDESQDFPKSFFELCELVTRHTVYIAGDIFQSIFDPNIVSMIEPDFLLSNCYRTDPRTLMFAHAIGMGLFETPKLRWLEDKEWESCGYIVEEDPFDNKYILKREPIRRFEDLIKDDVDSMELVPRRGAGGGSTVDTIHSIIREIQSEHPTVTVDDIGVIFIDDNNMAYQLADSLEQSIPREFGWKVNKAYRTKEKSKDTLFVSNKNNVKGLEFPFVICVSDKISNQYNYRNALYMMLSRSFIKSYLLISEEKNINLIPCLVDGLNQINSSGVMEVSIPSLEEKEKIRTTIRYLSDKKPYFDIFSAVCNDLLIDGIYRDHLLETSKLALGESFDYASIKEVVGVIFKNMDKSVIGK